MRRRLRYGNPLLEPLDTLDTHAVFWTASFLLVCRPLLFFADDGILCFDVFTRVWSRRCWDYGSQVVRNLRAWFANKFAIVLCVKEVVYLKHWKTGASVVNVFVTGLTLNLVGVLVINTTFFSTDRGFCNV